MRELYKPVLEIKNQIVLGDIVICKGNLMTKIIIYKVNGEIVCEYKREQYPTVNVNLCPTIMLLGNNVKVKYWGMISKGNLNFSFFLFEIKHLS